MASSNPPNPLRDVIIVGGAVSSTTAATATAVAPTYAEGSVQPLSQDLNGQLRISGTILASSSAKATTAAPSYTNNTDNSFSMNLSGDLRTIAKQSGPWTVGVDQTTPGVTNAVDVTNFPVTVDVNSGVKSNNTIRVTLATDQVQLTNALKVDGSSVTQPVSGTFYQATQPVSAASLPLPTGAATETTLAAINTKLGGTLAVSGTFWQSTQPVSIATAPVLVAGSAIIGKVGIDQTTPGTTNAVSAVQNGTWNVGHGKTIKTATVNITADTDIIAAVSTKRIKVIAYALFKTGINANPILFKSNGVAGTEVARILLQSQASAVFGANLSVPAPSFLFATAAGEKLTIDVGDTDTLTGFITYFDDDAT